MSVRAAPAGSVWIETGPDQPELPEIDGEVRADVAVLGGGIVGVTTALLLAEAGVRVALLEANRIAHGVSGYTTAKVSSQHGMIYARLRERFGAGGAAAYGAANQAALEWIAGRVASDGIDCDFRRRASYAYGDRAQAEQEAEAAAEAGLPASLTDTTPLPYPVEAAVRFEDQAEFHPRKYLLALAERLRELGCDVFERSRAVEVDTDEDCMVKSPAAASSPTRSWSPRTSRSSTARSRSRACTRSGRTRWRAGSRASRPRGCSSAPAPPRARCGPCRSAARSCCWSAARATARARAATPSSATRRSSASRASTGTSSRSSTAGPRRTT